MNLSINFKSSYGKKHLGVKYVAMPLLKAIKNRSAVNIERKKLGEQRSEFSEKKIFCD